MDEKSIKKLGNDKNSVDLFDQISRSFGDIYDGKGSFMEYAKSKEEEISKIKDDIFSVMYGTGFKDNLLAKKLNKKTPKSNL